MPDLTALQKSIGLNFKDCSLLEQALVHSSYLNENSSFPLPSNERLEFLGDAVLGLVVAEKLYRLFPHLSEGEMTRLRGALVCGETLARLAASLHLGGYLYLGRGEERSGGRSKQTTLAAALEAIMGAIFIDQGFAAAKNFGLELLRGEIQKIMYEGPLPDYKSELQELVQARMRITPAYRMIKVTGPDHNREFIVEVAVGGKVIGKGRGRSKQLAESEAAKAALETLNKI
jgi:ribonuclease-3